MKVIVIIVNYGTPLHVITGLDALVPELRMFNSSEKDTSLRAECWVVDNASPDDSVIKIQEAIDVNNYLDCVSVIASNVNAGFGAGNNVVFRKAHKLANQPEYFYLLNPDAIVKPGTLDKLMGYLDKYPKVGAVGGPVQNLDGTYECGAFRLPNLRGAIVESLSLGVVTRIWNKYQVSILPPPTISGPVGWVSGANIMIRGSALEAVGLFDEGYFLYFEEVDLCWRMQEKGCEVHFIPDASVLHEGGASTKLDEDVVRLPEYWHNSRSRYLRKAFGGRGLFVQNITAILSCSLQRIYSFLRRKPIANPHFIKDLIQYNFFK